MAAGLAAREREPDLVCFAVNNCGDVVGELPVNLTGFALGEAVFSDKVSLGAQVFSKDMLCNWICS